MTFQWSVLDRLGAGREVAQEVGVIPLSLQPDCLLHFHLLECPRMAGTESGRFKLGGSGNRQGRELGRLNDKQEGRRKSRCHLCIQQEEEKDQELGTLGSSQPASFLEGHGLPNVNLEHSPLLWLAQMFPFSTT
jgi:hypothetical protein